MPKTLRLILGDQLNEQHSWFKNIDSDISYVLMEILPETQYVRHHIQKIIGFFLAMRTFCTQMQQKGHQVIYFKLDQEDNAQEFESNISQLINAHKFEKFEYLLPDEYRLDNLLKEICHNMKIPTEAFDTEHFLSKREDLSIFFRSKKTYLMESFYRNMRKKYNILMDGNQPLQGQWNFDKENRKKYNPKISLPEHLFFRHEVREIYEMLLIKKIKFIGQVDPKAFDWPINRKESLQILDFFLENCLKYFGMYQDAMVPDQPYLFHSRLSFSLNIKLLHPLEVIQKAIEYWEKHQANISIAQIEGFVRQILGWREYMRGVYWAHMPEYAQTNYFDHQNKLPDFYWTGKTKMYCMQQAIQQSLTTAYAHHIQRLMLTGNFALLAGVHPDLVDEWYLGIYMDAIEWVEITNTRGMSQFADGGIVGSKPYVSSANYIDKMSFYCGKCHYNKKKKYGDKACPFNSLYWHFYDHHANLLKNNPRVAMMFRTWEKMPTEEKQKILQQASFYLKNTDNL